MASPTPVLACYSGWLASGKDTVAVAVNDALRVADPVHLSFAAPLKDELDAVLAAIRFCGTDTVKAVHTVAANFTVSPDQAARLVDVLAAVAADPTVTARSRTPEVRAGLQVLGTDIRRAADTDYWARAALAAARPHVDAGRSVYFTDARFPNEIAFAKAAGFLTVRLEVTRDTQARRLWDRDRLQPDAAALTHLSETALDGYPGFDLVVDNNGDVTAAVDTVVAALTSQPAAA